MPISEILQHKYILAVDDEPDVLEVIKEELAEIPDVTLHTAKTFERAREYLVSYTYDIVILDIMGVQGFDLLKIAVGHNFPVVMLTAHALNPEALKKSIELGARAYLPKDKLGAIVPFLEDVVDLNYRSVWRKALDQVAKVFDSRYGSDWRTSEKTFWDEFDKKLSVEDGAIID
jgi:DNA-binding NarL/FixJ family response regulator